MELNVSIWVFFIDVVLFIILGYSTLYVAKRMSRYGEPLNRFIVVVAVSLFTATIGRALDIVDDFTENVAPIVSVEWVLYFLSIIGIAYGMLSYISHIERIILPVPSKAPGSAKLSSGGYLYMGGSTRELVEFISSIDAPVLVITRSPWKYENLGEHVQILWVTQVTDKGIGLTKLHVVIESAVKFLRGGGRLIVVDCLETLILYNDFTAIFRFLTALKDHAVETKSAVLVVVDKETLKERELNVLLREFIPVRNLKSLLKTSA
ncbi:DUF835 domain-containing protein [Thermococcus piezophilus]|uniref:DUF835 domain-containing protein n=1 Tax=Thermococcus piezophilus TaxID=1712654 RepID=A0A172WG76_9EURY|nr:DUF835 domain-containing protein [Thermococcus piezophilus]ANF22421.1 hypothetical protein A7C91_03985 [Thermococcus piezophilus]